MKALKLGVIGVGGMGGCHARNFSKLDEIDVVAVADVNEETANTVASEIGATAFTDYKKVIRKGAVEAILIATPHPFHPAIAEYAARHDVHVLCEKPIAISVAAADRMIEACEKSGVLLGVVFQQRTEPVRRKMKQMVDDGVLGDIHRLSMVAPWYRTQAYYDSGSWRGTWNGEGGGILMNQAPHSLDQFSWIGGTPKKIQGIAGTRLHDITVENTSVAICDYGDGKIGWLYASTADIPVPERFEIVGDKGALVFDDGKLRHLRTSEALSFNLRRPAEESVELKSEWHEVETETQPDGYGAIVKAFAEAVHNNDPSLMYADGNDGLRSLELANAMLLAGYTRKEVSLPLSRKKYEKLLNKLRKEEK
ncbi:MAG TPA: Gfo/Idh/MocA family oxidoreductase [Abditibacteriaceae bacterium]